MTNIIARIDLINNVAAGNDYVSEYAAETVAFMLALGHIEIEGNRVCITPKGFEAYGE